MKYDLDIPNHRLRRALRHRSGQALRRRSTAFTLAELLIVCGVIVMVIGVLAPSIHSMINRPPDSQAEQAFGGMLSLARGYAIEHKTYTLLHGQPSPDKEYWLAVFAYDSASKKFVTPEGVRPQQVDGFMGFGEVSSRYVNGSNYTSAVQTDFSNFATFNVIFAPDGSLTTTVDGAVPLFDTNDPMFSGVGKVLDANFAILSETGVQAVTVFEYKPLLLLADRQKHINAHGRFLVINAYTGRIIENPVKNP